MTHTQTQGADGAGTITAATAWLLKRLKAARSDSEAHPEGHSNRTFYAGQAIAYENVLSLLEDEESTPAPAATPGVPDSLREAFAAATDSPVFVHDFADPAVSSAPGCQDVSLSFVTPDHITAAFMGNGLAGTIDQARKDAVALAAAWNHVRALIAAQPAGQAGDAGLEVEDESALSDRKELSGQNVSLSPLRGQIANAKATGVNGEMVTGEAHAVFDPARTPSDPYDDRPGPWYDMKKVREIEAATGLAFAAVHPERALGRDTDGLIEGFAAALKAKLRAAEAKYGWQNGWLKDDWSADCQRELMRHVGKGDPLDVAAYAAFCWHHGWSTSSAPAGTPDAEKYLSALTAAVSTCINDKGITDLGTIKRAWFYARTGRDEPVGSRAWDELRAMVRASEASSGLEGAETIQVWPLVEPAPNSTRTRAAETEVLPTVEDTIRRLENVRTNARHASKVWLANTAHYAAEWLRHHAARPEAPSDAGWSFDMEAAPQDGTRILLWMHGCWIHPVIGYRAPSAPGSQRDCWREHGSRARIHRADCWRLIPAGPTPPSDPAPSGQAEG